jgi:hypothetical protein
MFEPIFISSIKLKANSHYTFEVKVAKKTERIRRVNPFLLQAKDSNTQEVM